jgi:shikimate kinase
MRVLLTGFMGAGKTTVGRRLAQRLELPFFDLDEVIAETAGMSVQEIFESQGEETFRKLESDALERMLELRNVTVATGGGTLVSAENSARVRGRAVVVWLDPSLDVIRTRLGGEGREERPLYGEPQEMEELLKSRLPTYRQADLRIGIGGPESVDDVVDRLIAALEENQCATS